jgi:hypothetical protein
LPNNPSFLGLKHRAGRPYVRYFGPVPEGLSPGLPIAEPPAAAARNRSGASGVSDFLDPLRSHESPDANDIGEALLAAAAALSNATSSEPLCRSVDLVGAHRGGQRDRVWDVPADPKLVADGAQNTARRAHLDIEMTHIPYRGAGPAITDVIGGRVDVTFNTFGATLFAGARGPVAWAGGDFGKAFSCRPELPTIAETALPGFDVTAWYALFVPAQTPPDVVHKLNADAVAVLAEPAIRDKMEQVGVAVVGSTPEELARHLKAETELWGRVIKASQHPERVRTASFRDGAQAANPSAKSTTLATGFPRVICVAM